MPLRIARIGARERAALRRQEALELRVQGKSYRRIGEALGVSGKTAHGDITKALADLAAKEQHLTREMRQLDLARIDKGIAGLTPAYEAGDPKAVTAMVRLLERRAKLLGLDAPSRSLVGGDPDNPPIAVQVDGLTSAERVDKITRLLQLAESRRALTVLALPPPLLGGGDGHCHDGSGGIADE
jgi:hypothetical protein